MTALTKSDKALITKAVKTAAKNRGERDKYGTAYVQLNGVMPPREFADRFISRLDGTCVNIFDRASGDQVAMFRRRFSARKIHLCYPELVPTEVVWMDDPTKKEKTMPTLVKPSPVQTSSKPKTSKKEKTMAKKTATPKTAPKTAPTLADMPADLKGQDKVAALNDATVAWIDQLKAAHKGEGKAAAARHAINPTRVNADKGKDGAYVDAAAMALAWVAIDRGYESDKWMTVKQALANGATLPDEYEALTVPVFWNMGRATKFYEVINADELTFPEGQPTAWVKPARKPSTKKASTKAPKAQPAESDEVAALKAQNEQLMAQMQQMMAQLTQMMAAAK